MDLTGKVDICRLPYPMEAQRSIDFLFVLTKMTESPESLSMTVTPVGHYLISLTSFVSPYL